MTSVNAHHGPVDLLVAVSSTLSPDLLKRDSLAAEGPDSACGGDEQSYSSSQDSLPPSLGEVREGPQSRLLQYRIRSTIGLPGRRLTAQGDQNSGSSLESLEHSLEDGSIYELSDDPNVWVKGRPTGAREGARRDAVTSAAVVSAGRGFRRIKDGGLMDGTETNENALMVWQLPLRI